MLPSAIMRVRGMVIGLLTIVSTGTSIFACVGADPVLERSTAEAGSPDVASSSDDASDGDADGGAVPRDGSSPDAAAECGARDTTPCGCGAGKSCCIGSGAAVCQVSGNEDPGAGCTSTTTLRCVGTTCGGGRVCCFNGERTTGAVCGARLTAFDTECADVDAADPFPCVDAPSGARKLLTCLVDEDCQKFDAGACLSAVMDGVGRVLGVCAGH